MLKADQQETMGLEFLVNRTTFLLTGSRYRNFDRTELNGRRNAGIRADKEFIDDPDS